MSSLTAGIGGGKIVPVHHHQQIFEIVSAGNMHTMALFLDDFTHTHHKHSQEWGLQQKPWQPL